MTQFLLYDDSALYPITNMEGVINSNVENNIDTLYYCYEATLFEYLDQLEMDKVEIQTLEGSCGQFNMRERMKAAIEAIENTTNPLVDKEKLKEIRTHAEAPDTSESADDK